MLEVLVAWQHGVNGYKKKNQGHSFHEQVGGGGEPTRRMGSHVIRAGGVSAAGKLFTASTHRELGDRGEEALINYSP